MLLHTLSTLEGRLSQPWMLSMLLRDKEEPSMVSEVEEEKEVETVLFSFPLDLNLIFDK